MFVAGNMGVIVVWVMMPTSGRSVTVRWRQQAPLKFWYIPTRLHDITSQKTNLERNTCQCNDNHMKRATS